ncbi:hypothetical protein [Rhizobium sp. OAE497]|uniref:hypothetical protein n=1 Tax=Rhizobium sp. OAE497 TaxID=2663796 RepID=UPI0018F4DA02
MANVNGQKLTKNAGLRASVDVSSGGLLSIAALVSSILLSTAVLVHVATRDARSKSLWRLTKPRLDAILKIVFAIHI